MRGDLFAVGFSRERLGRYGFGAVKTCNVPQLKIKPMDNKFSPISFLNKDFLHSYERRKFNHDYQAPYKYHIILKKQKDCEAFGRITGKESIHCDA